MPDQNWQFELEAYIKQGEPSRIVKSEAWQTAIGLQAVDGLNTSEYLLDTAIVFFKSPARHKPRTQKPLYAH